MAKIYQKSVKMTKQLNGCLKIVKIERNGLKYVRIKKCLINLSTNSTFFKRKRKLNLKTVGCINLKKNYREKLN
jgi:hypothetical protein